MHYHCEIIIPPTEDIEGAIAKVMKPFDENNHPDAEDALPGFWDWYVIGGRWTGAHVEARLDADKLDEFNRWMADQKVMVQGFIAGKQTLADAETTARVDAKWRETFPGAGEHCLLFSHAGDQYENSPERDACRLDELSERLTASRLIFGALQHNGELGPKHMLAQECWNGVNHVKTFWDGNVLGGVQAFMKHAERYAESWRERCIPRGDWLVVTVDYHS